MNCFIAYFDYLGYSKFIENNDLDYQKKIIRNNFRDIESALGKGKFSSKIIRMKNLQINIL